MPDILEYSFMQRAIVASVLIGVVCSVIGVYVVLRGLAFIGAGVAHASFGGVALGVWLGVNPLVTAVGFCLGTAWGIGAVARKGRVKEDTAIGIFFASTMAFGILLIGLLKEYNTDLFGYLFGSVLAISVTDLWLTVGLSVGVLATVGILYKELLFITFDPEGAEASGLPATALYFLLLGLLAITIVVSIQVIGIILVSALLVAPAAAAQQLTTDFKKMMALSAAFGITSALLGLALSYILDTASGATIVLTATGIFFFIHLAKGVEVVIDVGICVEFLQRLMRTESMPGKEGELTGIVQREMERLGYQEVHTDEAGNLIGLIRGRGEAPAVMFNTHLDHVAVGDPSRWPYPPFGGEIHDGKVWGRGAMDIKGPLAAQVYGVGQIIAEKSPPPGDVYVTGTVQEEVGGLGARHLITHMSTPLVVVGEATSNQLRRGHRGRVELVLHVVGRSVHASIPAKGINPHEVLAKFVLRLKELQMQQHPDLGPSSVTPTLIRTDQTSPNVIPAEAWLTCDWRNVAGETPEAIRDVLQGIAEECLIKGAQVDVQIPVIERESYTGLKSGVPSDFPSFITPADHTAVKTAEAVLGDAIGLEEPAGIWRFATDGGHFAKAGMTVIGYGPGDETLAHTINEHIEISQIETALVGNRALAFEWPSRS